MRANLLPRSRETVRIVSLDIETGHLRQAAAGLLLVAIVGILGWGIESLRLNRIESAATDAQLLLGAHASERDAANRLALDVARYQEIAREESSVRRSGSVAARDITLIGNRVPPRVWLDSLTHDSAGFELIGGSHSVDALSGAIGEFGNALAGRPAMLVNIDNRDPATGGVRFTARISNGNSNESGEPAAAR